MTTMTTTIAAPPKRQQANPRSGGGLTKTIVISDMDPTRDKVYKGCVIYGTIIDLPDVMVSLATGSPSSLSVVVLCCVVKLFSFLC
jgi:hypothetical protein